jgi:hypothetical protein
VLLAMLLLALVLLALALLLLVVGVLLFGEMEVTMVEFSLLCSRWSAWSFSSNIRP